MSDAIAALRTLGAQIGLLRGRLVVLPPITMW